MKKYSKEWYEERAKTVTVAVQGPDGKFIIDIQPAGQKSPYDEQIAEWTRRQHEKALARLAKAARRKKAA